MGYDLKRTSEVFGNNDNHDWLASAHGTDATDSITLDAAAFLTAFPTGEVPAGVEVSRQGNGTYRPYLAANSADTLNGFLFHGVRVTTGVNEVGALLWHGEVIASKVPLGVGQAVPTAARHPHVRLV